MRTSIRFLLDDEMQELSDADPTLTVLDWLRDRKRLTGTKEGCNEGDCGACTVVVVRPGKHGLDYRAVNSCIQFVGQLDGAQLLTVEHLKDDGGRLHPVQRAMVDCHGSQCGFCTPGFVMSMFALTKRPRGTAETSVDDALAGNLCRCTGYAPIVRAMQRTLAAAEPDRFEAGQLQILHRLQGLDDQDLVAVADKGSRFLVPATVEQLAEVLEDHPDATILAGATDVGLWVTKQMRVLDTVVWIGRIAALREVRETSETVEVGAGATFADCAGPLARLFPDFGEVLRRHGSVQTRNAGTIGGNIANGSPIGDAMPLLIAVSATLHLRRGAERRSMPLEDFFIAYGRQDRQPGEFIERISVPRPAGGTVFRAYKVSKRFDQDISAVLGAFCLRLEDGLITEARVAFGGMAATPKRAPLAEAALVGRPLDAAAVANAQAALAQDFQPIGDMRASSTYRLRVAQNLIERLRLETGPEPVETRLARR